MRWTWVVVMGGLLALFLVGYDLWKTNKLRARTVNPNLDMGPALFVPRYHNGQY